VSNRESVIELFYDNNVRCDQRIEDLADDVLGIVSGSMNPQQSASALPKLNEVRTQIKSKTDSALNSMRKADLIEYIRTLEQRCNDGTTVIDELIKRIEALPPVKDWNPVSDPPKKDGEYIVFITCSFGSRIDIRHFAIDGAEKSADLAHFKNVWYMYSSEWGDVPDNRVAAWMPLPEAPKEV